MYFKIRHSNFLVFIFILFLKSMYSFESYEDSESSYFESDEFEYYPSHFEFEAKERVHEFNDILDKFTYFKFHPIRYGKLLPLFFIILYLS